MADTSIDETSGEAKKSTRVEREWFTPTEAMKYLGVSRPTLYHMMDTGLLKFYTIKGVQKRRIRKEDLDALFEEGRTETEVEKPKSKRERKAAR